MRNYIVYTRDMCGNTEDKAVFDTGYEAKLYSALYNDKRDWKSNASFVKIVDTPDMIKTEPFAISWRYPVWRWIGKRTWNVETPQATLSTTPRFFISRMNKETQLIEGYVVMDKEGYSDDEVISALSDYMNMEVK